MSINAITAQTIGESYIVVNGISYTQKEYKKMLRDKGVIKPKKKAKKQTTDIQYDAMDIKALVNGVKLLKSLKAWHTNGYRQWGTIHKTIVGLNGIRQSFSKYNAKYWEIKSVMDEINKVGSKSEKAVYQYMEKLSYLFDDMIDIIKELSSNISRNNICQTFANEKAIYENEKRLGLKELMSRVSRTLIDMQCVINKCSDYSLKGFDTIEYNTKSLNGMLSCWSKNER